MLAHLLASTISLYIWAAGGRVLFLVVHGGEPPRDEEDDLTPGIARLRPKPNWWSVLKQGLLWPKYLAEELID